ncbi:3-keto-5-aminohexanoate cleavage protein [Cupriavidus pinatubonensis]|uniref:3-keto-5-aminohexanoate cleavage protein n=1 Tax=Cupriavidus pinatubonensis TaxID=248026 RepID=UPI001128154D|nr:3-keto-5-aminohexanoate cleavage protein [Cupriavidus pinatubonensis]TPQ26628.1 NADPH:quinone reductase [Cupriavidus pinatubonensis]
MQQPVILTCAVTGGDDTAGRFESVPVTPAQIAAAAIDACKAGAAIAHIHVRNPDTGKPSMDIALYREVVDRIRDSGSPVIINLTTGPGARFVPSNVEANRAETGSNLRPPVERVQHILELKPEICSLDMGSLNFGKGALLNVPAHIETIAAAIRGAGVKPELEVFDMGHIALSLDMIRRGLLEPAPLFQMVLGAPWGAPASTEVMAAMKSLLPVESPWAAFGVGRQEFPMVAQALILGGHVRVGLEDNLYLSKGVLAPDNAVLVRKAASIVELLGSRLATPDEARSMLGIHQERSQQ